ncbi:MAG TPA: transcription termination factor NusA [Phycisphaerae bacterium]|nr:transcription termination factor NusA [Phycisphaerae bacterium]HUX17109.1 transcription termination factor NusA [Phycisphaerae bacterium]
MNGDLLRLVEVIRREKSIDAEIVFEGIELALVSAAKKHFGDAEEVAITIDRETGQMQMTVDGEQLDPAGFGRIAAQTAKQVIIQKIREAERASLMENYADQVGTIITGQVTRIEHGSCVINLSRGEGFLPKSEQIPGETLHVGDRLRAIIIDVRESGANVKIVLSRTHPDLISRLFELEVPEVADRIVVIEAVAREPGRRTKVAVSSTDSRVDAVGACVGIRGSRIKNIVAEVANEKVDIARYNESPQVFISEALKPAQVKEVLLNRDINRATVLAGEDQLSLAIGKKGQNVRLAARLAGWNIDIMTPAEYDQQRATALEQLSGLEAVGADLATELVTAGYISLADVAEVNTEILARAAGVEIDRAQQIMEQVAALVVELEARAAEEKVLQEAQAEAEAEAKAKAEAEAEAETETETESEPEETGGGTDTKAEVAEIEADTETEKQNAAENTSAENTVLKAADGDEPSEVQP